MDLKDLISGGVAVGMIFFAYPIERYRTDGNELNFLQGRPDNTGPLLAFYYLIFLCASVVLTSLLVKQFNFFCMRYHVAQRLIEMNQMSRGTLHHAEDLLFGLVFGIIGLWIWCSIAAISIRCMAPHLHHCDDAFGLRVGVQTLLRGVSNSTVWLGIVRDLPNILLAIVTVILAYLAVNWRGFPFEGGPVISPPSSPERDRCCKCGHIHNDADPCPPRGTPKNPRNGGGDTPRNPGGPECDDQNDRVHHSYLSNSYASSSTPRSSGQAAVPVPEEISPSVLATVDQLINLSTSNSNENQETEKVDAKVDAKLPPVLTPESSEREPKDPLCHKCGQGHPQNGCSPPILPPATRMITPTPQGNDENEQLPELPIASAVASGTPRGRGRGRGRGSRQPSKRSSERIANKRER